MPIQSPRVGHVNCIPQPSNSRERNAIARTRRDRHQIIITNICELNKTVEDYVGNVYRAPLSVPPSFKSYPEEIERRKRKRCHVVREKIDSSRRMEDRIKEMSDAYQLIVPATNTDRFQHQPGSYTSSEPDQSKQTHLPQVIKPDISKVKNVYRRRSSKEKENVDALYRTVRLAAWSIKRFKDEVMNNAVAISPAMTSYIPRNKKPGKLNTKQALAANGRVYSDFVGRLSYIVNNSKRKMSLHSSSLGSKKDFATRSRAGKQLSVATAREKSTSFCSKNILVTSAVRMLLNNTSTDTKYEHKHVKSEIQPKNIPTLRIKGRVPRFSPKLKPPHRSGQLRTKVIPPKTVVEMSDAADTFSIIEENEECEDDSLQVTSSVKIDDEDDNDEKKYVAEINESTKNRQNIENKIEGGKHLPTNGNGIKVCRDGGIPGSACIVRKNGRESDSDTESEEQEENTSEENEQQPNNGAVDVHSEREHDGTDESDQENRENRTQEKKQQPSSGAVDVHTAGEHDEAHNFDKEKRENTTKEKEQQPSSGAVDVHTAGEHDEAHNFDKEKRENTTKEKEQQPSSGAVDVHTAGEHDEAHNFDKEKRENTTKEKEQQPSSGAVDVHSEREHDGTDESDQGNRENRTQEKKQQPSSGAVDIHTAGEHDAAHNFEKERRENTTKEKELQPINGAADVHSDGQHDESDDSDTNKAVTKTLNTFRECREEREDTIYCDINEEKQVKDDTDKIIATIQNSKVAPPATENLELRKSTNSQYTPSNSEITPKQNWKTGISEKINSVPSNLSPRSSPMSPRSPMGNIDATKTPSCCSLL